jgi:hypothetical protein
MNRTLITAILLLPLLAWAQYDTPTLSSVVRVDAFVPVPKLSEDFLLNGDVECVVYLSKTPNVIRTYPWSCFEKKHRIQDVITDERWEYEYDTTGKLQRMHSQYTMRGDYFIHDMSKPFKKKNEKVYSDYYHGEKNVSFQGGCIITYTEYIPNHTNDTTLLRYNLDGNLVYLYKSKNSHSQQWHLFYDSLNRLVYVDDWNPDSNYKNLPQSVYAFQYDSDHCTAVLADKPTCSPKGDLRRLHYHTHSDNSTTLHVTWCDKSCGSDSLDYILLHNNPADYLETFFDNRLAKCEERDRFAGNPPSIYELFGLPERLLTPGEYTFDPNGWLIEYSVDIQRSEQTEATILYDTCGRIVEMRADTGILLDGVGLIPTQRCTYVGYKYDDHNNIVEIHCNGLDERRDTISNTLSYRYTYDSHGNWIRRETYYKGKKMGVDKREITYYSELAGDKKVRKK